MRKFAGDDAGATAIIFGLTSVFMLGALALGVDTGKLYFDRRRDQSAIDLAAMAAAADPANATAAATRSLTSNGIPAPKSLVVTLGAYTADPTVAANARFKANSSPMNAVRLQMRNDRPVFFGKGLMKTSATEVAVASTAVNTKIGSFHIGSRLASLQGGVANALLGSLLGGSVSLSVMDYNQLASANIDILPFLSAVATHGGIIAGSYNDVLNANVRMKDVISAMADVGQGSATAKAALKALSMATDPSLMVTLNSVISLGPAAMLAIGDPNAGLAIGASAFDLLNASAEVANGDHQLAIDLSPQVPGLLSVTATIDIGERPKGTPWLAVGAFGTTVTTAQTRIRLAATVGGTGSLLGKLIYVPLAIDVAAGKATLTGVSCGAQPKTDAKVTLGVRPAVASIWLGEPQNLSDWKNGAANPAIAPATILNVLGLIKATAYAQVSTTNLADKSVMFNATEMAAGTVKTVSTTDALQTTLSALMQNVDVQVNVLGILGIGVTSATMKALLGNSLTTVGAALDPVVVSLLQTLGVSIGQADVWANGARCDGSALVQ